MQIMKEDENSNKFEEINEANLTQTTVVDGVPEEMNDSKNCWLMLRCKLKRKTFFLFFQNVHKGLESLLS